MRFFDAHCDTIGPILEEGADFTAGCETDPGSRLHVTLPGLKTGNVGAQVFASWAWSGKYKGREFQVGMAKVDAVRRLCADYPDDLVLAKTGEDLAAPFAGGGSTDPPSLGDAPTTSGGAGPGAGTGPRGGTGWSRGTSPGSGTSPDRARTAVLPGLEGADPLLGEVDNLFPFYDAGVRVLTLAWGDNPFCGSTYGDGSGLTKKGVDLVAACEASGVIVDVSHLSDKGFEDILAVAERPFIASHSNCRSLCASPRNLTDDMIRSIGSIGGVVGIALAPGFLSHEYYEKESASSGQWYSSISTGREAFDDVWENNAALMADVPRPPFSLMLDHVKWAINVGGEDCVGLGGDLDGVDYLPAGLSGVEDYPRIEELLRVGGLAPRQIDKICHQNFLRVFREILD